jgi:hypothetical protein
MMHSSLAHSEGCTASGEMLGDYSINDLTV